MPASDRPEIRLSDDGSATVYSPRFNALYHSHFGALRETEHVFVQAGMHYGIEQGHQHLDILELGFGTGLNAAASWVLAKAENRANPSGCFSLRYVGVELFPLPQNLLNVFSSGDAAVDAALGHVNASAWPSLTQLDDCFSLEKKLIDLLDFQANESFDCIYQDCFAPQTQPELWTSEMFARLYASLRPGGVLVTYCAQGQVRRNLRAAGFRVEKLAGPPGKREMTRAHKS